MTFTRHPVDIPVITQPWGANRTGGITPDPNGTAIQQLVYNYGNYQSEGHDGIDYGCPIGTRVYAPGPGVIEWSGWGQDMPQHIALKYGFIYGPGGWPSGILVCIDMDIGPYGCYVAHLSESYYETGQRVTDQTLIGLSGNTGRSGGPHVHFSAIRFPLNYGDPLYSRVSPLPLFTTVTHVPIRIGDATGDPATPNQEWYLMPDIPKDNLLQIVAALKSVDFGAWLQAQVAATPIKSTDGKLWPLRSHLYGITQRQQQAAAKTAAHEEILAQILKAQGVEIDYTKVQEAVERGLQKDNKALAEAIVDEQAERLAPKGQ